MAPNTWFGRIQAIDVRVFAAVAATLLLIIGVMWIVPTTPNSNSFTFDTARRDISDARPIVIEKPINGTIVDGSDADFYRIDPVATAFRLNLQITNGSKTLVPAVRVFDAKKNLIAEKAVEYVRSPGANVDCSFLAQSNMTYYVQVSSQRNTTGPYTLTATVRQP
jgi:hypothetical protein